jgi:hypothetical protein
LSEKPHYLSEDDEIARTAEYGAAEAAERKAARDRIFGPLWIIFGIGVTLWSMSAGGTIFYVMWGAVLYGAYVTWRGHHNR